jgi:hypothetical protein
MLWCRDARVGGATLIAERALQLRNGLKRKELGMQRSWIAALLIVLSACAASEPRRVSETAPMVSYSFTGDRLDDATEKAQNYCEDYNLDAELIEVDRRSTDNVAHFECR